VIRGKLLGDRMRDKIRGLLGKRPNESRKRARSETVIVALRYSKGIVLAADRQVTDGRTITSYSYQKIVKVGKLSAVGFTGTVGTIQSTLKIFEQLLEVFRLDTKTSPLLENQIVMFHSLLREIFVITGEEGDEFIFAGYDEESHEGGILEFDSCAGKYPCDQFIAIGSGTDGATAILEDYFQKNMVGGLTEDAAIRLAVRAVAAAARDVGVSHPFVAIPTVVIITPENYRTMDDKQVEKITFEVLGRRRK